MPNTVEISADRYEELVKTEERVSVLHKLLAKEGYMNTTYVLRILGFDITADKLEKEKEKRYEELCEMDADL